ncbi:hypothetical protein [Gilvibacter sp.]|uniref:hypothetical protein n=1 Tax=Gilvibacter sp. TaxID=2729997 RepID=UPI0025C41721|nr:hypothetical protein [Gilvibacter sp.]NQX77518.1 hypothetical protein [Gilvibacter sp.]
MPQDFTASALPAAVMAAQTGFAPNGNVDQKLTVMPEIAAPMLMAPRLDMMGIGDANLQTCQPVSVYWPQMDDASNNYSNWTSSISGFDCTPVGGNTVGTLSRDYDVNLEWQDGITVNLNGCGNQFQAEQRITKALNDLIHMGSKGLNDYMIAALEDNKSNLPATALTPPEVTVSTNGDYIISNANYWGNNEESSRIMPILEQLAKLNGIYNPIVFGGTSHSIAMMNAMYSGNNADNNVARFGSLEMYTDTLSFDTLIGKDTLYIMDRNTFGYLFWNDYTPTPQIDTSTSIDTTNFTLPLQYYTNINENGNMTPIQYAVGSTGQMRTIQMDVRAKLECTGNDRFGRIVNQYVLDARIWGMHAVRPVASNQRTGILKVKRTA